MEEAACEGGRASRARRRPRRFDARSLDHLDARTRVYIVFVDTFTARMSDDIGLRRNLLRFIDRTVQPGVTYVYAVMAVDKATPPNQSALSNKVQETAR